MTRTQTATILSLAALVSLFACGRTELIGHGDTGDTGEPELEPPCQVAWEWRQRVDDVSQLPEIQAIDVDEAGNVYAIGDLDLSDFDIDPPVYKSDIWVAGWASDGSQVWVRTFSELGQVYAAWSLQVVSDGGLFVLGTVDGSLWLARLDPETGDELWSQVEMGGFYSWADLAKTADEQLIVLGQRDIYPNSVPWLSERSPVDGSVAWTRSDPIAVGPDKHLSSVEAVAVSDTGDLRVSGTWMENYPEGPGAFDPQDGDLLLTYDPLGELLEVEASEGEDDRRPVLIDSSASVYVLSGVDALTLLAPTQIESRAVDGSLEWIVTESEWAVGGGFRELSLIDLGNGALDIAGDALDVHYNSSSLWTAKIDPDSGALMRGCVHMVEDPDTGAPMLQGIIAGASGPAGGLALYGGLRSPDPHDDSHWVWMRYLGG